MYRVRFPDRFPQGPVPKEGTGVNRERWSHMACRPVPDRSLGALNMNVLHITNSYPPNAGVMATAVHALAGGLNATGHRTLVLTPWFNAEDGSDEQVLRLPSAAWKAIVSDGFRISPGTEPHRCIERFAPDLVHVHGPFLLGPVAMRLADELGLPLVYTHHTQLESYIHYCDCERLDAESVQGFYVGFANQCDLVLAPSGVEVNNLEQLGVTKPLQAVPTGLDSAWFTEAAGRLQDGKRRTIGLVGRVSAEKSAAALAGAVMAYLEQDAAAELHVIGDGDQLDAIRQEAGSRGLSDRVVCMGFIPSHEVRSALDRMDVVVNAPDTDTQCIVLLEAQARGVPVLSSDIPLAREFVADCGNGINFHASRDWAALTASLAGFFALPPGRRMSIRSEVKEFAQRHGEAEMVHRLCRLYATVIAVRRRHGTTLHRHWDSQLVGWVYQALTDGLVPVIQGLRTP